MKKEAEMTNQEQCPNCGGYKIDRSIKRIDPKTGKQYESRFRDIMWIPISALLILCFYTFIPNPIYSCGFAALVIAASIIVSKRSIEAHTYPLYSYYCNLCGYRWEWHEGQPWPKVKVNPDLMARGAQKLEEEAREAEEERKRQEALYHLSKFGKK
jgi:hypothetical protein